MTRQQNVRATSGREEKLVRFRKVKWRARESKLSSKGCTRPGYKQRWWLATHTHTPSCTHTRSLIHTDTQIHTGIVHTHVHTNLQTHVHRHHHKENCTPKFLPEASHLIEIRKASYLFCFPVRSSCITWHIRGLQRLFSCWGTLAARGYAMEIFRVRSPPYTWV